MEQMDEEGLVEVGRKFSCLWEVSLRSIGQ